MLGGAARVSFGRKPADAEIEVIAAVARIREAALEDGEDLTSSEILEVLRLEDGFEKLSLTQVKTAERKIGSNSSMMRRGTMYGYSARDDDAEEEEDNIPGFKRYREPKTGASKCNVRGNGLEEATVRQASYFWIEACDENGRKRTSGGDTFFVAIRGPSQTRARVTDNFDGTYLVVWKPYVSGVYTIAVSLFGELLPGAPFVVQATTTNPCASKSSVRGESLNQAVSRAPQQFDIMFRDRLGQVARAVDIDVFVEPIPPSSPRGRAEKASKAAEEAPEESAESGSFREKKKRVDKKSDRKLGQGKGSKAAAPATTPFMLAASPAQAEGEGSLVTHEELNELDADAKADDKTRSRTLRVKVKDRPLIVRAGFEKDSEQIGVLLPGQIVTVVEERLPEAGEVRACVALDSVARAIDGLTPDGGSAGEYASKFRRAVGDVSPKHVTAELSPSTDRGGRPPPIEVAAADVSDAVVQPPPATEPTPGTRASRSSRESMASDSTAARGAVSFSHGDAGADGTAAADGAEEAPKPQVGWVTLVKSGRKLVSSRVKLGPGSRRQYLGQWARRKLNDRAEHVSGHLAKTIMQELNTDPTGIGFGFGGVEPGVLHAQGKLHEVHKVSYSIGLAGHYLLHVRLRQQAMAVVGSPFHLHVLPGPAHAKSTKISTAPLRGMVGTTEDTGCVMIVHVADRMGNLCSAGGAKVQIDCHHSDMVTNVEDMQDGTYRLKWNSKFSGTFQTRVLIDKLDTIGSPREFTLTSSNPNLSLSKVTGEGLKSAVAGKPSTIRIAFVDDYGNIAIPGPSFKFGMSLSKEKEKLQNAKPHDFEGAWEPGDTGVYEMKYIATVAGGCDLHIWCDPNDEGSRTAFKDSPFHVNVTPGRASPAVSVIGEWTKVQKEEKSDKQSQGRLAGELYAGDTITLRPQIFDEFKNATQLPEGALKVLQKLPNGMEAELNCNVQNKGGLTTYEIRHDTSLAGTHNVHVYLFDAPVSGSPVTFEVLPDKPEPIKCKLFGPPEETLLTNQEYKCVIQTFDKFENKCIRGGLQPQVRLQLAKTSVHDQTTLVPSNHFVSNPAEDQKDGEYFVRMNMQIPCQFKVNVNIDKNIPSAGGELPPITVTIQSAEPVEAKEASTESKGGKSERRKSMAAAKLQAATTEMMKGFGDKDERREKDIAVLAVEAFADALDPAAAAATSSPNQDLFDKAHDDKTPSPGTKTRRPSLSAQGGQGGRRRSSVSPTEGKAASESPTPDAQGEA